MADVHNSLSWTQSDALAEVVSAESCHIALEPSPPDYVEKISRYLESSVGQDEQDKVCHEPAEDDSDSGDSLFITQKPVPEAVRSARRGRYNLRKHPIFLSEESDGDSLSSHGESRTAKRRKRQKCILPKYSFPFLSERKWKPTSTLLPTRQNTSLHNFMMGGFFKCVRERWQGLERGDDVESSLPTVDVDGDCISPLSEEEEEGSEVEDIKVVEKKHFVVSLKAKSRHAWCNQLKQRTKKSGDAKQKIVFQQKAREEELCDDSDATVCELPIPRQYVQNDREASTTVTEPQTDVFHTDDLSQTAQAEDEPESQSLLRGLPDLTHDANNDSVCSETRVKKRKKKKKDRDHESVEEEKSQEEPQDVHAAAEETPSLSQDDRAEPLASQTSDELELNERNCIVSHDDTILRQEERDIPNSKQKKKKRKKTAAENVGQEVDGNLELDVRVEDSVFSASCNVDSSGKKKKSKRSGEDVEQLQSNAAAEPLNDDAEIQTKKEKRKKGKIVVAEECEGEEASNRTLDLPPMSTGQLEESGDCLENTSVSGETLESTYVKRKKHKNKHQSSNNAIHDGEEGGDVNFSNDALILEESTGMPLKKKKRKKKKTILEGVDISRTPEENEKADDVDNTQKTKEGVEDQNAELVTKKKKKKKKKTTERSNSNIFEDSVAQSNDSVSAHKKEKKRTSSFLVADAEENDAQTHGEQNSQSHVWGAEKPAVSTEVESAEITGNVAESNNGVRKKKRRRKVSVELDTVEKDHKLDFEEPNETCSSALPETTDAGVKRKKKRMGNESELVVPMERLESAADAGHSPTDEAVVLKKKKKKKKCKEESLHVIQESPPAATEDAESGKSSLNACSSVSHKKKGKHLTSPSKGKYVHSASSTSDQATMETLNMVEHASPSLETPGNQALNHMSDKKKKKKKTKSSDNVLVKGKSAELENKKKKRNKQSPGSSIISSSPVLLETSLSKSEMSSSDRTLKNRHMKARRRLLNPSEDFLTDY